MELRVYNATTVWLGRQPSVVLPVRRLKPCAAALNCSAATPSSSVFFPSLPLLLAASSAFSPSWALSSGPFARSWAGKPLALGVPPCYYKESVDRFRRSGRFFFIFLEKGGSHDPGYDRRLPIPAALAVLPPPAFQRRLSAALQHCGQCGRWPLCRQDGSEPSASGLPGRLAGFYPPRFLLFFMRPASGSAGRQRPFPLELKSHPKAVHLSGTKR